MKLPLKSPQVAKLIGCSYTHLMDLIRRDRVQPLPQKDCSGDYAWSDADVARARAAFESSRLRRKAVASHA
jgi:hypothetical protein